MAATTSFDYELRILGNGFTLDAGALLAVIAPGAAWVPARRAARVDPMVVLRYE